MISINLKMYVSITCIVKVEKQEHILPPCYRNNQLTEK